MVTTTYVAPYILGRLKFCFTASALKKMAEYLYMIYLLRQEASLEHLLGVVLR